MTGMREPLFAGGMSCGAEGAGPCRPHAHALPRASRVHEHAASFARRPALWPAGTGYGKRRQGPAARTRYVAPNACSAHAGRRCPPPERMAPTCAHCRMVYDVDTFLGAQDLVGPRTPCSCGAHSVRNPLSPPLPCPSNFYRSGRRRIDCLVAHTPVRIAVGSGGQCQRTASPPCPAGRQCGPACIMHHQGLPRAQTAAVLLPACVERGAEHRLGTTSCRQEASFYA